MFAHTALVSHACLATCSQLPEGAKTRLAARLTPQMVPPGHDLCQEGDDADCMWILQEGNLPLLLRCCDSTTALSLHMHASLCLFHPNVGLNQNTHAAAPDTRDLVGVCKKNGGSGSDTCHAQTPVACT